MDCNPDPQEDSITEIRACRISGSRHLISVLNLGEQYLTGVFPRSESQHVTRGPLELVWCPDSGLLQLKHSYSLTEMYGDNYGYRSGLNASMVTHLKGKVRGLERNDRLREGDWVLDIGSNDATLLKAYETPGVIRIGMDPTANKFREFYPPDIAVVPDFFSADRFLEASGGRRAKVITSIAMFYDLEDPGAFVADIARALAPDGIWHFEQSYMPSMLRTNSYDTVCHEHLEYYSLAVIRNLLERHGLRIINVQMNGVNGGSVAVTACHERADISGNQSVVAWMLEQEQNWGLDTPKPYRQFEERVFKHRADLQKLIRSLVKDGKRVLGYGASTKGNVLLQFCQFGPADLPAIAEVNAEKFGAWTPGTGIPIISEADARAMRPDFFLVLALAFQGQHRSSGARLSGAGGQAHFSPAGNRDRGRLMPRSLIVGAGGQDGRILWDQLLACGHTLIGLSRKSIRLHQTELGEVVDILNASAVLKLIAEYRPDQIYYLAAHHHSSQDSLSDEAGIWRFSNETHVHAFRYVLEAARVASPDSRIFYASSSRVFGLAEHSPQTEDTPVRPICIYGVTKAMGMMLADFYRRTHGLFVACGILFNHESPLRGDSFVSQRIVKGMARVRAGSKDKLRLGDLQVRVDWGYAPDYTAAMPLILEASTPQDFVIASGTTHSIRDLVVLAAEQFELSWEEHVIEDRQLLKRPPQELCGDASRLTQATGWRPRTSFRDMVRILAEAAAQQEGLSLNANAQ